MSVSETEQVAPNVVKTKTEAKRSLVLVGSGLVGLFVLGLLMTYFVGSKEKVVGHPASTQTTGTGSTTQTTTIQANQTTTRKGVLSDTVLEALLATGGILIIVGLLYGRITVIKFPGGGEIDLNADEVKKTAAEAQKAAEKQSAPPEAVSGITATALAHAREEKRIKGGRLSEQDITKAATDAAAGYMSLTRGTGGKAAS